MDFPDRDVNLEEFLEPSEDLGRALRHDTRNPLGALEGYLNREEGDRGDFEEGMKGNEEEIREFCAQVEDLINETDDGRGWVDSDRVENISEHYNRYIGVTGAKVNCIIDICQGVNAFQQHEWEGMSEDDFITLEDTFKPLEKIAESAAGTVDYSEENSNVRENELPRAEIYDNGVSPLAVHTIGLNWTRHANGADDENAQLLYSVDEGTDHYSIELWDNGPGLQGKDPEEVFEKKSDSEFGLYMASTFIESYGGELEYFEPETGGFGLRMELRKPSKEDRDELEAETAVLDSYT